MRCGTEKSNPAVNETLPEKFRGVIRICWQANSFVSILSNRKKTSCSFLPDDVSQINSRHNSPVRKSSARRKPEKLLFARSRASPSTLTRVYSQLTVLTMNANRLEIPLYDISSLKRSS